MQLLLPTLSLFITLAFSIPAPSLLLPHSPTPPEDTGVTIQIRGCGTIQPTPSNTMIGLQGNDKCNALPFEATTIRVGEGCVCHTFANEQCSYENSDTWTSWVIGPWQGPLDKPGTRWYHCASIIR